MEVLRRVRATPGCPARFVLLRAVDRDGDYYVSLLGKPRATPVRPLFQEPGLFRYAADAHVLATVDKVYKSSSEPFQMIALLRTAEMAENPALMPAKLLAPLLGKMIACSSCVNYVRT